MEQGERQAAEREAQVLAETGDAALVAEAGRLLARHQPLSPGPGSPTSSTDSGSPPADPPRVDFPSLDPAESENSEPDRVTSQQEAPPGEEPDKTRQERDAGASAVTVSGHSPAVERSGTLEWRTIDYQPPQLDPEPPSRQETPMQPSVEFPRMSDVRDAESSERPAEETGEAEWEVEEVAFPPLDRDNGASLGETGKREDLEKARDLLENGDRERARPLLQQLLDSSDSPLRDEARDLFTHYRL